jgi:ribonuclease R
MFMVEANEAVARLLDSLQVPFLRRTHPEPEPQSAEKLRTFVQVAGFRMPKDLDRKAIQHLLAQVKGKPESFAINLAVLKSLTRAEYSPETIGHFALASQHYCHFTSPIRRYADLTVHRLLDAYFEARDRGGGGGGGRKRKKVVLEDVPTYDELVEIGRHISFTERRADDAERELRQIKLLELMQKNIGQEFRGVVTGITNFGIFVQIQQYLVDGLIRYDRLLDDWWDVDDKAGFIRGQRTGQKIAIGDVCRVVVARVDMARRELDLSVREVLGLSAKPGLPRPSPEKQKHQHPKKKGGGPRGGGGRGKHPLRQGSHQDNRHQGGGGKTRGRGKRGRKR